MLIDYSKVKQIYIVCGKTDMRKSIDGLASVIQDHYNMDVFGNGLFLFCGGSRNKYKALYWCLWQDKRTYMEMRTNTWTQIESGGC